MVLLVPLMVIFRRYGLINTYPGLILAESTNTAPVSYTHLDVYKRQKRSFGTGVGRAEGPSRITARRRP